MAHMIGEQFSALKKGDRFFYDNNVAGTRGMTLGGLASQLKKRVMPLSINQYFQIRLSDELAEIRRYDVRNIFCAGSESSPNMPVDLFRYG